MTFLYVGLVMVFIIWILFLSFLMVNSFVLVMNVKISVLFGLDFEFLFDLWSLSFSLLVLMVSTIVMVFCYMYMKDMFTNVFVLLYLMFVFSMQFLIYSNSFYWLMLGWDGLGVVSFYLIYYYVNFISLTNSMFTLFQNRLGDLFFIVTLVYMNYYLIVNLSVYTYLFLGLLIWGACVKSAQFPFSFWLLSAMSAPTPISALVHSSTLVVAGVFVIMRFSYCLFEYMSILKLLSVLTLFISFLGLIYESDMKKLIAYSTMNHVSIMMFLMSVGLYKVAFFHLNIHAMFKSMLFMGFGVIMLLSFHNQSSSMISLGYSGPIFKVLYYFSCLSLSGLPFLVGFFSKDFIIENLLKSNLGLLESLFMLFMLGASVYYSLKLLNLYSSYEYVYFNMNIYSLCLLLSVFVMILFVNYHVSSFLMLSYEVFSFKFLVYLVIFVVLILLMVWVFKLVWPVYMVNFLVADQMLIVLKNFYLMESFVYLNFYMITFKFVSLFSGFKSIYMLNWWILFYCLLFIYNVSFMVWFWSNQV